MAAKNCRIPSSFKPLAGHVYYLDVKPSKRHEQLKLHLKKLGAHLEEFLSKDVKYLVTDRLEGSSVNSVESTQRVPGEGDTWLPETPASGVLSPAFMRAVPLEHEVQFPDSPLTDSVRTANTLQPSVQSRGQALLERAKHKLNKAGSADVLEVSRQWGIKILPVGTLWKSLETLLRKSVTKTALAKSPHKGAEEKYFRLVQLDAPFIKVEDIRRQYRPFYKQLEANPEVFWDENKLVPVPKSEDENSMLKTPQKGDENMGLAARAREICKDTKKHPAQRQKKKLEYCEICGTSYNNLSSHVLTTKHSVFMRDEAKFLDLKKMVLQLPTTKALRQRIRPLAEQNHGTSNSGKTKNNQRSDQKSSKRKAEKPVEISDESPLIRRVKVSARNKNPNSVDQQSEDVHVISPAHKLFMNSEDVDDNYVEPSCNTSSCHILGCLGGEFCLNRPLFKDCLSAELPLQLTNSKGKGSDCSCCLRSCSHSTPHQQPVEAHQSSSTVPFISTDVQPLNLSMRNKQECKDEKTDDCNTPKNCKRQLEHLFFSENACVSSLGLKENALSSASTIVAPNTSINNGTILSFSNLTFPESGNSVQRFSKNTFVGDVERTALSNGGTLSTKGTNTVSAQATSGQQTDVHLVRKALFMSESTSPDKSVKPVAEKGPVVLFDSDQSFSSCSLSDQMVDVMSSETDPTDKS